MSLIPKRIWQTWKTHDVPAVALGPHRSWSSKNPGWQTSLFDDEECRDLIARKFPRRVLCVYDALPKPVMRADMWRYAVLAVEGGVYSDLDTSCNVPIDQWLSPRAQLVICPEPGFHWLQWTIASAPGNAVMVDVVEEVCRRVEAGINTSRPDMVHYYTGPWVFGDVVWKAVRAAGVTTPSSNALTSSDRSRLLESGIQAMPNLFLVNAGVTHHYGGNQWHGNTGYVGWKRDKGTGTEIMKSAFEAIYRKSGWGKGSGPGSDPVYCKPLIDWMSKYIQDNEVQSMCDIGCGDQQWAPKLRELTGVKYIGIDCVPTLITQNRERFPECEWIEADVAALDPVGVPEADLYFIKDVLQHWPSDLVTRWLRRWFDARPTSVLITTNCSNQAGDNRQLDVGGFCPLSGDRPPLVRFSPVKLMSWHTKTVYRLQPEGTR